MTSPMAFHRTFGPAVDPITRLGWGLGLISIVVILTIGVLLLLGIFRRRIVTAGEATRDLTVSSDSGGVAWIYIGVGISSVVLIACTVWTMIVAASVSHSKTNPALTVDITASQWWWSARYRSADPDHIFTTANEIHIPTGEPVRFELASGDVIHSFWIPQLAGKMDVIPGQVNTTWLQADRPGVYRGQCTAFCGVQHANMALRVIADTPADFAKWQANQLAATGVPATEEAHRGEEVFEARCAVCHTVRGVSPAGLVGPDLSHLKTRATLAAGLLPNTTGNLAGWIANAQSLKPGSRMPDETLSGPELTAVTAYLNTLH